jgi:hypothetical protein
MVCILSISGGFGGKVGRKRNTSACLAGVVGVYLTPLSKPYIDENKVDRKQLFFYLMADSAFNSVRVFRQIGN